MQQALESLPDAGIGVMVVWVPMLAGDSLAEAARAGRMFHDARVSQFFDAHRAVAKAVALTLGSQDGIAWDAYLWYAPGAVWTGDGPPASELVQWVHQLGRSGWADPGRYRYGEALAKEILSTTGQLTGRAR